VAYVIYPKPSVFDPAAPPPGVRALWFPRYGERPKIRPRIQLAHTNGASSTGSIESSFNWATSKWGVNTMPHFQLDLDGDAAQFLPTDRKGIGNYQIADYSIVIETADAGYGAGDPAGAFGYTDAQIEKLAHVIAYNSIVWDIPLSYPVTWDGSGTASHTEPFGYPYWTNSRGKVCPGWQKKLDLVNKVLPYARAIVSEWTRPAIDPFPVTYYKREHDMFILHRNRGQASWEALIFTGTNLSHSRSGWILEQMAARGVPQIDVVNDDEWERIILSANTENDCAPHMSTVPRLKAAWDSRRYS
jgi:hypothetical protein